MFCEIKIFVYFATLSIVCWCTHCNGRFNSTCMYTAKNKFFVYYTKKFNFTPSYWCVPSEDNRYCKLNGSYHRNNCSVKTFNNNIKKQVRCLFPSTSSNVKYKIYSLHSNVYNTDFYFPFRTCICSWENILRQLSVYTSNNLLDVTLTYDIKEKFMLSISSKLFLHAKPTISFDNRTITKRICKRELNHKLKYRLNCNISTLKPCYNYTLCLQLSANLCSNHMKKCIHFSYATNSYEGVEPRIDVNCKQHDKSNYVFHWDVIPGDVNIKPGYYYKYQVQGIQGMTTNSTVSFTTNRKSDDQVSFSVCQCYCSKCGRYFTISCPTLRNISEILIIVISSVSVIILLLAVYICFRRNLFSLSDRRNRPGEEILLDLDNESLIFPRPDYVLINT